MKSLILIGLIFSLSFGFGYQSISQKDTLNYSFKYSDNNKTIPIIPPKTNINFESKTYNTKTLTNLR